MLKKLLIKFKNVANRNSVNIRLEKSASVAKHVYVSSDSKLGRYCYVNEYTRITKAIVEDFVSIGNNVAIGQGEHDLKSLSTSTFFVDNAYEKLTRQHCTLKSDSWIGSYAFIKRGVTVGYGAVVGTHAVVTKDVPDYAIVVGVPAKVIGYRFDEEIIKGLLRLEWWNWTEDEIGKNRSLFQEEMRLVDIEKLLCSGDRA